MGIFVCLSILFLVTFTPTGLYGGGIITSGPVDIALEPILSSRWSCYIQENELYIKNFGGAPLKIKTGKEAGAAVSSPNLVVLDKSIFVAWTERIMGANRVRLAVIKNEAEPSQRDVELPGMPKAEALKLFKDDKGRLYLIGTNPDNRPEISIYLSTDNGEHFQNTRSEIDGAGTIYNLSSVVVDDTLFVFFSAGVQEEIHFAVKSFEIPSLKPKEHKVLKDLKGISFVESLRVKDSPMVIYKTSHSNRYFLEGFVQKKDVWEAFAIKGAEGLDVARVDSHAWEDGRILIVFSGEEREKFKQRVYVSVSNDMGKSWETKRIDRKESDKMRSWLPRMAVDNERVMIVWEDSRDIRSQIRMILSSDRGETWSVRDVPVSEGKHYSFRPRVSSADGAFYVAWHQFRDDEKNEADISMTKLTWDEAIRAALQKEDLISIERKEHLLRERVRAYWEGMIKKDFKATYELHDPFYKAKIPFDYYRAHRGPMVYHAFDILDVKIEGNEAAVKVRVKYAIPKIIIMGKESSVPPTEISTEDTYLFIDGAWYRKFVDALSGGSSIDY